MPLLILQFLKRHGEPLAVLALLSGVFFAGRLSVHDKPAKVITEVQTVTAWRDRAVEKVVTVQAEAKRQVIYRDRVVKPDGTTHEKSIETTDTQAITQIAKETEREHEGTQKQQSKSVVEAPRAPDWRVGVLVGAQPRLPMEPLYGAVVERRVLGPVSVGAWGLYRGPVGLAVTVEF